MPVPVKYMLFVFLVNVFVEKFGVEYIERFFYEQAKSEMTRYKSQKDASKDLIEFSIVEKNHKNNVKALIDLKSKMVAKYGKNI